ncbi:putative transposase domain protein [Ochrobactrum quorumnocens]|uniref:Putative transposase domain protein n=1 Tax=Ochrobactrum quorumnocens TaxID=271865 RepID=A0A248UBX5_9HYPH|nr:putative transposase domain protein [[Ochrobactrum] quorumnocens]
MAVPVEHTIECAATKGDFFLLIGKLTGAQPVANDGFVTPH